MKLNKGFTLIELLAIITILAVILLVAFPNLINITKNSKDSEVIENGELYLEVVEQALLDKFEDGDFNIYECEIKSNGNILCNNEEIEIKMNEEKPTGGIIIFDEGKISEVRDVQYKDYLLEKNPGEKLKIKDKNQSENCKITYKTTIPNKPELGNLTPVVWDGEAWAITTSSDPSWYDYEHQKWANAVILNSGVNKKVGDIITVPTTESGETDIVGMFVWIPRYEYKIDGDYGMCGESASLPGAIDIQFIPIDKKEADENYIIHPAFWWDNDGNGIREAGEELSGIWVGKFETTGNTTTPTVLPNQQSLVNITPKMMFDTSQKLSSTYFDSHMAKNSEWGAVAYLSQSKYGKYGNQNYTGANKEVYKNDSGEYINGDYYSRYTGRSSGKTSTSDYSKEGTCTYDNINTSTKEKKALCGEGSSTTGNITGVYDMSGGAYEYVMGYVDIGAEKEGKEWGSRYSNNTWNSYSGFTTSWKNTQSNLKYYKEYQTKDRNSLNGALSETACDGGVCYGEALSETRGWYGDAQNYPYSENPWFLRGGGFSPTSATGVFSFNFAGGGASVYHGFRLVLVAS